MKLKIRATFLSQGGVRTAALFRRLSPYFRVDDRLPKTGVNGVTGVISYSQS